MGRDSGNRVEGDEQTRSLRGPAREEEHLYALITEGIASKQIRPGARLKESALAERFGVSRARVRRVLQRLVDLDVVEFRLNLGAMVCRPGPDEARAVFRIRRVLEAEAVRSTIHSAGQAEFGRLRAFVEREEGAFAAGQSGLAALASGFHTLLGEVSGNPVLAKMLNQLIHRCVLIQSLYERDNQATICLTHDHAHIVDAMERGDVAAALSEMDCHFDHIERSLDYEGSALDERIAASLF